MAIATPFASASLYVGDLVNDVTEALLFEIFNAVGPVASVRVCRDAATRRSLGYAYVNFHRLEDAERALDTMNFKNIKSRACRIMWSHRDPSLRKSGLGNIFVKNLAPSIDNKSLYDTFSMFGNILSCKVSTNSKRESLGYGFVHYEDESSAQGAIGRVNGKVIAGQQVNVAPFRSKKERGVDTTGAFTNVYVKNIDESASENAVQELFSKYGTITSMKVSESRKLSSAADKPSKVAKFGFINFSSPEEAAAAVEALNGHSFGGQILFVGRAQRKDEREKELREHFESLKVERQKKYEGVNLYVKNLGDNVTDDKLREEFKVYGNITSCKIMMDGAKSKGFGFVCFQTPDEATKAVTEMNNHMLDGKPLYVSLAQRKEVRHAQLEAQRNQRQKMGLPPPQMYPPQGTPMFYAPGMPPRNFMYPHQMMPRRWQPGQPGQPGQQQQPQMLVGGVPGGGRPSGMNFSLMPVPNNGRGQPGQPGGGPNQRGGNNNSNRPRRGNNQNQNQQQQGQNPNMMQGQGQRPRQQGPGQQQGQYPNRSQQDVDQSASVAAPGPAGEPLTIEALAAAEQSQQKQMIGERLFPLIKAVQPEKAGKVTGMLLEMDNGELIHLLENDKARNEKIEEALAVLSAQSL